MIDIRKLYVENSSVELLNKLNETNQLNRVMEYFTRNLGDKFKFYIKQDEYITHVEDAWRYIRVQITDYTYIEDIDRKVDGHRQFEDASDKWRNYLVAHLQGEAKETYLRGLQQFAEKMAKSVKKQIKQSAKTEQAQRDLIDLQPKKRLIKEQVEKSQDKQSVNDCIKEQIAKANARLDNIHEQNQQQVKGKTSVIKPEITKQDVEQALESVKHHDAEHGQLL